MLVQLSDPHVVAGPDGDAAAAALAEAVDAVLALPVAPEAVLVSGDLTHDGAYDSYYRVQELLAPLESPLHVIPGNHDQPRVLYDVFGGLAEAEVLGMRLLLCETQIPGSDAGRLDVAALEARLDDRPTIVAMHHPPLRTGIKLIDDVLLPREDREALAALLARSPQVVRVVCGHVHRVTFTTLGGCGVFTAPSTHMQIEPGGARGEFAFVPRGRGYAMHALVEGDLVSQVQVVGSAE